MRRRRVEGSLELRKAKKEENLMKRRNMMPVEDSESEASEAGGASPKKITPETTAELSLEECAEVLLSAEWTAQEAKKLESAVENVRRKLSRSNQPPIRTVISLGLVHPLVRLLATPISDKSQFEAAWAITNIVSGTADETAEVVKAGGVGPLVQTLSVPALYVAEQAAWALGNIAGDGASLRDAVLCAGVLPPMIALANRPDVSVEFLRTLAWAFSNFCRHKNPPPSLEVIQGLLPYMATLLCHPDKQVVTDTAWACSYATDGPDEHISAAINAGILPRIVQLLASPERGLAAPALRTLGNIVAGNDSHTQAVIDSGVLSGRLADLLRVDATTGGQALKETVWLLSNVLAGNPDQIQAVIDAGLLPDLVRILEKAEHKVRSEAAWAVVNLTTGGTPDQAMALVNVGLIPALTPLLALKDNNILNILLEALLNLLEKAKSLGLLERLATLIEEADGLDQLEELQNHEDTNIYNKALNIIETFFTDEDDLENHDPNAPSADVKATDADAAPAAAGYNF